MDLESKTIKQLKKELDNTDIDYSTCKLKKEFITLLQNHLNNEQPEEEEEKQDVKKDEIKVDSSTINNDSISEEIEMKETEENVNSNNNNNNNNNNNKKRKERQEESLSQSEPIKKPAGRTRRQTQLLEKLDDDDEDEKEKEPEEEEEEEMEVEKPKKQKLKKPLAKERKAKPKATTKTTTTISTSTTIEKPKTPYVIPPFREDTSYSERLFWKIYRNIVLKRQIFNVGVGDLESVERYPNLFSARWLLENNYTDTLIDFVKSGRYLYWQFRFGSTTGEVKCDYDLLSKKNIQDQDFFLSFYTRYKRQFIYVSNTQLNLLIAIPQIFKLMLSDQDVILNPRNYKKSVIFENYPLVHKFRKEILLIPLDESTTTATTTTATTTTTTVPPKPTPATGKKTTTTTTTNNNNNNNNNNLVVRKDNPEFSINEGIKLGYAKTILSYLIDEKQIKYSDHKEAFSPLYLSELSRNHLELLFKNKCISKVKDEKSITFSEFEKLSSDFQMVNFAGQKPSQSLKVSTIYGICLIQSFYKMYISTPPNKNNDKLLIKLDEIINATIANSPPIESILDIDLYDVPIGNEMVKNLFEFHLDLCANQDLVILVIYCGKYNNLSRLENLKQSILDQHVTNQVLVKANRFMNPKLFDFLGGTGKYKLVNQVIYRLPEPFKPNPDMELKDKVEFVAELVTNMRSGLISKAIYAVQLQEIINLDEPDILKSFYDSYKGAPKSNERVENNPPLKFKSFEMFKYFIDSGYDNGSFVNVKEYSTGIDLLDILKKPDYKEYFDALMVKGIVTESKTRSIIDHSANLSQFVYFYNNGFKNSTRFLKDLSGNYNPEITAFIITHSTDAVGFHNEFRILNGYGAHHSIIKAMLDKNPNYKDTTVFDRKTYRTSLEFSNNHKDLEVLDQETFRHLNARYLGTRGNLESIRLYLSTYFPTVESKSPNGYVRSTVLYDLLRGASSVGNLNVFKLIFSEFNHVLQIAPRKDPYGNGHLIKKTQIQECIFDSMKIRAFETADFLFDNLVCGDKGIEITGRQLASSRNLISMIYASKRSTKTTFDKGQMDKIEHSSYLPIVPETVIKNSQDIIEKKKLDRQARYINFQNHFANFQHQQQHHYGHYDSDDDSDDSDDSDDFFGHHHHHHHHHHHDDSDDSDNDGFACSIM